MIERSDLSGDLAVVGVEADVLPVWVRIWILRLYGFLMSSDGGQGQKMLRNEYDGFSPLEFRGYHVGG